MLDYNELKPRKYIVMDGDPYEVLESHVFRKQQRKPVNQTKLRNLISGKVVERSFHQSERIEEADISMSKIKYLYKNPKNAEFWFCDIDNPGNRFSLSEDVVADNLKFIKENSEISALVYDENVIGIKPPIKVELAVKEAPPAVKGNTAQGANKQITLETGAVITAPIFINEGDTIRINTETGEYTERVEKA